MYTVKDLFDLNHTIAKKYFNETNYPFEILPNISNIIIELSKSLDKNEYKEIKENVWVHVTAKIFDSAYINGPCIIGANTQIRQCAFIRGNALVGENCVIGNSCELKNVIIFDNAEVPHFNYVGDSILGFHAHMGAGSATSNVRADRQLVKIHAEEDIETNLKKVGAFLGDYAEIGCNAVLNPGTIIGRNSIVYPTSCVRGVVKENTILTNRDEILPRK